MSEFVKTQQEHRANLVSQIREIIENAETESRGLDSAELEKIDRIEIDISRAAEAIDVAQRNEVRRSEAEQAARNFTPVEERKDEAEIFRAMANGEVRSHTFGFEKRATLVPSVNTVPIDFLAQVFSIARLVGPMLDVSDVITRSSGNDFRIPTLTTYSAATAVAAGSAISESEPTFSSILLQPKKQAFIVKLANELIMDSGFNIEAVIAEQAGNAIGFRVNALATVGAGSTETEGVVTAAGSGVTAGTTTFTADDLISLAYSLDGAARRLPGVAFMASTATMGFIRRLKDDEGQYIYNPQVGGPDTILGYPVVENPAMADFGTSGAKPVVFGHLPSYKLVTTGLEAATSSDAFFANDVTAYRFTYRFDGKLTHPSHVKYLEHAS